MKQKTLKKSVLEKRLEEQIAAEEAAQSNGAAPAEGEPLSAADEQALPEVEVEVLAEQDLEALPAERDQLKDQLLRARAEFDNYRRRMARETERIRKTAAEQLVHDLLPVVDNLERAVDHADTADREFAEGIEMVLNQFYEVLGRNGVEPIPAVGELFNPHFHEAVMRLPSAEYPADVVAQELLKGYRIDDYVVRPAKVAVSAGAPEDAEDADEARPGAETNSE